MEGEFSDGLEPMEDVEVLEGVKILEMEFSNGLDLVEKIEVVEGVKILEGEISDGLELVKDVEVLEGVNILEDVEVLENDVNNDASEVVVPHIGMKFANADEMYEMFRNYARHLGFPVKKRSSKKDKDDGRLKHVTFACSRGGKHGNTSVNLLNPQASYRIGCKVRLSAMLDFDEKWKITVLVLDHNHDLSPNKARFFPCNRKIDRRVRRQLVMMDKGGVRANKSFNTFVIEAGGHENMSFIEKDFKNELEKVRRLRVGEGDAHAIQEYFKKMQRHNTGFYFNIDLDEKNRLKNVFWADGRSREAYKEFGEVVTFDTTYLTNKYDMPFAPFVGVNHHGQSTLLGCGLISNENTETFVWLFNTWLACMSDRAPNGIITDQDRAMQNAIGIVFPETRHRWCLWHVMKKLPEKLGGYTHYESISYTLKGVVYDTQNAIEFEKKWPEMIEKYNLHDNTWLSGLYKERHRWVPCFVKTSFWAGMSTTQRSESINAFFDGYVNSKTTLRQFVEQYDNAVRSKVEKEAHSDFKSFARIRPCVTHYGIEKQVQNVYTMSKFKEFQKELTGKMYCDLISIRDSGEVLEYDIRDEIEVGEGTKKVMFTVSYQKHECEVKCSCNRFEFRGMLCRHALSVLIRNDVNLLPEKYLLRRWRKDVRRSHTRIKINFDGWQVTDEQLRYDQLCLEFTKLADIVAPDKEVCTEVSKWISNKINEISAKKVTHGSNPTPKSTKCEEKASKGILDPKSRKKKGRPESVRKESKIAKKIRKKINKSKKAKDVQTNDPSLLQMPDVNPTQECVALALTPTLENTYLHPQMPLNCTQQQLLDYQKQLWDRVYGSYGINPMLNYTCFTTPPPMQGFNEGFTAPSLVQGFNEGSGSGSVTQIP